MGSQAYLKSCTWSLNTRVVPRKEKWTIDNAMSLAMIDLPSDYTSKMAGRLSNMVTTAYDMIGRAQLKAIYAQTNAPIAPMTSETEIEFGVVDERPLLMIPVRVWLPSGLNTPCPTIWIWTEAAGKSKKWLRYGTANQRCYQAGPTRGPAFRQPCGTL